ncbi:MAG: ribonuclease HII [Rhodospirillales bacterium]
MPDFRLEDAARGDGHAVVAGVDEAGRGPWAGPVVAGAVILDRARLSPALERSLDDSKKLPKTRREALFEALSAEAHIGVGRAEVAEIDALNILGATLLAMARAVDALGAAPDLALVDGNRAPALPCPVRCVVRGDGQSLSIAAASIAAKVTRDEIMAGLADTFPGYGWERNAGYGTPEHRAAIERLGVTPVHRRTYAPIREALGRNILRPAAP